MSTATDLAAQLNTILGEGTIQMGSDPALRVRHLATGVLPLDVLLDGGLPRGRITEVYGDYSTLKSFLALRAIATTQAAGGTCALIDTEHAYDPEWLSKVGGDPNALIVQHPDHGEDAVAATEVLVRGGVALVVWDSVAATLPKAEYEKRAGDDTQPARLAALMSKGLRRLNSANHSTALLMINQTRINVGQVFGNPETTPGGKALGFYASYRLAFRKAGRITGTTKVWDGEKMIDAKETHAIKVRITVEKSKLSRPHRETWLTFDLRTGTVDDLDFLIGAGMERGFIRVTNHRYALGASTKSVHGREKFRASLSEEDIAWMRTEVQSESKSPGRRRPVKRKASARRSGS